MITLFPDEQIITESSEGIVVLTTHRICYTNSSWGKIYNQSIMLEHITSCENFYSSNIWLLILAVLAFIGSFLGGLYNEKETLIYAMGVALFSLLLFFISRKSLIIISSPSTRMEINVKKMPQEVVLNFINKVEQSKHKRILSISRH